MRTQLPIILASAVLLAGCFSDQAILPPGSDELAAGTWGGDNAGVIVDDSIAHVHVGCTLGNFASPVALDSEGRFTVAGEYLLRAYPVARGPMLPGQFTGRVRGNRLTLTVVVNDTVEKKTVTLGPVEVVFDQTPRMQVCPICRTPKAISFSQMRLDEQPIPPGAGEHRPDARAAGRSGHEALLRSAGIHQLGGGS